MLLNFDLTAANAAGAELDAPLLAGERIPNLQLDDSPRYSEALGSIICFAFLEI